MTKLPSLFRFLALMFTIILISCGKPLPEFAGIDLKSWKEDKKGCHKIRSGMIAPLENQRNKLQGLSEMQIIELLGRPDEYDLGKRHQKFFGYWLEPGEACGTTAAAKKLTIRFNATGAAKEVLIEL